jgi:hemoglobin
MTVLNSSERRAQITAEIIERSGIDEAMIRRLVHAFYAKVREDELLGPIFQRRVSNWDFHLQRMCSFWSSVILMTGRYHGQPMQKHLPLSVDSRHFDHWLKLFRDTAREVCPPRASMHFIDRAERIAESLELGIAGKNGVLLMKGQRFTRPDSEFTTETAGIVPGAPGSGES